MQLLRCQSARIADVEAAHKVDQGSMTAAEYIGLIKAMLVHFDKVTIVIDALDEAQEEEPIMQALEEILQASTVCRTTIQAVLTSRQDLNIERYVTRLVTSRMGLGSQQDDDIRTYITSEITSLIRQRKLKLRDMTLADEIVRTLVDHADGMWVTSPARVRLM